MSRPLNHWYIIIPGVWLYNIQSSILRGGVMLSEKTGRYLATYSAAPNGFLPHQEFDTLEQAQEYVEAGIEADREFQRRRIMGGA